MKKISLLILAVIALCYTFTSCSDDEWSDGDPALEHIYYFGFENWGNLKNDVVFNVIKGDTSAIAVQFHSERTRSYDVTTYYYVSGSLVRGTDYEIIDSNMNILQPDSNGAFSVSWPKAVKGIKYVYVKALNGSTGSLNILTFDPKETISYTNITNNITNDYEVRAFTQNYKVTVNIK